MTRAGHSTRVPPHHRKVDRAIDVRVSIKAETASIRQRTTSNRMQIPSGIAHASLATTLLAFRPLFDIDRASRRNGQEGKHAKEEVTRISYLAAILHLECCTSPGSEGATRRTSIFRESSCF